MTNVIARDWFFYSILAQIIDYFSCSPFDTLFIYLKRLQEIPEYPDHARIQRVLSEGSNFNRVL